MFLNFVYPDGIIWFLMSTKQYLWLKQILTNFISLFHIIGAINIAWSIETQSQLNLVTT